MSPDNPESFTGKVTYIVDGDTLSFSTKGQLVRITLNEIDAPEMNQPWSNNAYSYSFWLGATIIVLRSQGPAGGLNGVEIMRKKGIARTLSRPHAVQS